MRQWHSGIFLEQLHHKFPGREQVIVWDELRGDVSKTVLASPSLGPGKMCQRHGGGRAIAVKTADFQAENRTCLPVLREGCGGSLPPG